MKTLSHDLSIKATTVILATLAIHPQDITIVANKVFP
jgi:hypothetical protein